MMQIQSAEFDQTPDGFFQRLHEDKKYNPIRENKFFLKISKYGVINQSIECFLKQYECEEYTQYFIDLGGCNKLDDVEKCALHRIMIPRLQKLQWYGSQEQKDIALHRCLLLPDSCYFVARMLLIGLYAAGANVNQLYGICGPPLYKHLLHDDIPLIEYVLYKGADPNIGCLLSCCKSARAALILLAKGADFHMQQEKQDLIDNLCSSFGVCSEAKVLEIFLDYVQLNRHNSGKKWFKTLSQSAHWFEPEALLARVDLLLKKRCSYDDQIKEDISKGLAQRLVSQPGKLKAAQVELIRLFNRYEKMM